MTDNSFRGYGAPFYRVYYNKEELLNTEGRFSYVYSEEEDDSCTINFRLSNPNDVDLPQYQEDAMLEVTWGYINGPQRTRKVWINNAVPTFAKDNITLAIEASEKATVLKNATERTIHKNKGLPGLVLDKAEKHGLEAEVEVNPYEGIVLDSLPTGNELIPDNETSTQFIRRLNEEKARRETIQRINDFKKDQDEKKANPTKYRKKLNDLYGQWNPKWEAPGKETSAPVDPKVIDAVNKQLDVLRRGAAPGTNNTLDWYRFNTDDNITQAGKSDKQIITDTAKKTKGGPTIVETRDDKIIIKKRDYRQAPYKTYEYQGPEGELLEFRPETKNKAGAGSSSAVVAGGWNSLAKTYFQTQANPGNPANNASLAKALKLRQQYAWIQKSGGGGKIVGTKDQYIGMMPGVVEVNPKLPQFDKTRKHGEPMVAKVKITVDDAFSALDKAIKEYTGEVKDKQRDVYNALGTNPEDALSQASNKQQNNELKMNPATGTVWGDPLIETGIIVTIGHASKKHSGNYYITKSSHTIEKGSGYTTEWEGGKHGHNIISSPDYAPADSIGRVPNKQVGNTKVNATKSKTLKVVTNASATKNAPR